MLEKLPHVLMWAGIVLMAAWGILSAVWKRVDVSWSEFMVAGPLVLFLPRKFTQPNRVAYMRALTILAILVFVAAWGTSWYFDNVI